MTAQGTEDRSQRSIWPVVLGTGLAMLLVGAALGWFVVDPMLEDDSDADVVAAVDTTTTTTTAVATDPTLKAHSTGGFQATFPDGWAVGASFHEGDPDRLVLRGMPTIRSKQYEESFLGVTRFATAGATVDSVLDLYPPSGSCPDARPREAFSGGGLTGKVNRSTGCPNGYELVRVAVETADGAILFVSGPVQNGDRTVLTRALESYAAPAEASATKVPLYPCVGTPPSENAEYPIQLYMHNYSGGDRAYSYVNAAGKVDPQGQFEVASPLFYDVRVGDVYRVELPTGTVDYTATDEPLQCVILKPEGFELLSPPT